MHMNPTIKIIYSEICTYDLQMGAVIQWAPNSYAISRDHEIYYLVGENRSINDFVIYKGDNILVVFGEENGSLSSRTFL